MKDWLAEFAKQAPTEQQVFQEILETLPLSELDKLAQEFDPSLRPSQIDDMTIKVSEAARMGRELAQENGEAFEKDAIIGTLVAGAAKSAIGSTVKRTGQNLLNTANGSEGFKYAAAGLLQRAAGYAVRNPGTAVAGAGALAGAALAPRDQQTGKKQYVRGAIGGAAVGATANALSGGRMGGAVRSRVMDSKNPILGQRARSFAMDSAKATKGSYPKAPPMNMHGDGVSDAAATAATASPESRGVRQHPNSGYSGGPTGGQVPPSNTMPFTGTPKLAAAMRAVLEKQAFANQMMDMAKGMGSKLLKNKALTGAAVGAVGGAIAGGPDHRLSGAVGGAGIGAGVGHGIGRMGKGLPASAAPKVAPTATAAPRAATVPPRATAAHSVPTRPVAPSQPGSWSSNNAQTPMGRANQDRFNSHMEKMRTGQPSPKVRPQAAAPAAAPAPASNSPQAGVPTNFLGPKPQQAGIPTAVLSKQAFLIGGLSGYAAAGGDREASPRSGFWRGAGGGILGGIGGATIGNAIGGSKGALIGNIAGEVGGGILAGRTARPNQAELKAHLAGKAAEHSSRLKSMQEKKAFAGIDDVLGGVVGYSFGKKQQARGEEHTFGGKQVGSLLLPGGIGYQIGRGLAHNTDHNVNKKEKKANQQTLTYDPATKTFTRQHITADTSTGTQPGEVIRAGHTEPVRTRDMQHNSHRGQVVPGNPGNTGSPVHTNLHGGDVMSSSAYRGRPMGTPPPLPRQALKAGPMGLATAATKPAMGGGLAKAVSGVIARR